MKTLIELFIDASGSMATIANAVRSGVNEYVDKLRRSDSVGEVVIRVTTFSSGGDFYNSLGGGDRYSASGVIPIEKFEGLVHFNPSGGTPLLDCLARRIRDTKADIESAVFGGPDRVLFVIWTDGEENASRSTRIQEVQALVRERQNGPKPWQFVFLGANLDQFAQGFQIGGQALANSSFGYAHTDAGVRIATHSLANATVAYCASKNVTVSADDDFFSAERNEEQGNLSSTET